jgi:PKD repeat protein
MRMNREPTLARSIPILAVALVILVPIGFLLVPSEQGGSAVASAAPSYSYKNLFERNTVVTDRTLSYSLPADIRDMASGDLNSDSKIDLVVATKTHIYIYTGIGDGSLNPASALSMSEGDIRSIAVGDLNKDGKDDIAATYLDAGTGEPKVGIFNQATGFALMVERDASNDPGQVVIGKFNSSIDNDLAVACRGNPSGGTNGKVMLLRWPFTSDDVEKIDVPDLTNLKLLAAGYVDSDDRIDLVAGNLNGSYVKVLLQPATFSSVWPISTIEIAGSLTEIRMIDYAGNGNRDLMAVNAAENRVEIRVNSGTSLPGAATRILNVPGAIGTALGPITGAPLNDLAVISGSANLCTFYPRQPAGIEPLVYSQFPTNEAPLKAVAYIQGSLKGVYVLSNGASGANPTLDLYRYLDSRLSNADGNRFPSTGQPADVCAGNVSFGIVATILEDIGAVYISDLNGNTKVIDSGDQPTALFIGDLDGDGTGDLAIAYGAVKSVSLYKGGSSFMAKAAPDREISLNLAMPQSMAGGKVEETGTSVLVIGCQGGVEVIHGPLSASPVHEVIGTGTSGDRTEVAFGRLSPTGATGGIAAINAQDGHVDLFYVKSSPAVGDLYNIAPSAWLNMVSSGPASLGVGDFDENGRDDVAVASSSATLKAVMVFSNTGDGFYSNTPYTRIISLTGVPAQVRSGDLNDDGKSDLAISYWSVAKVSVHLSQGTSFVNPYDLLPGGVANGLIFGDANGDGRDDVVASSSSARALSYWLQKSLAPNAIYWLSSNFIDEGGWVSFDGSNSTDSVSDLPSLSYYWNFGDGLSSTLKSGSHRYISGGDYDGYLLVTDRSGNSNSNTFHVHVENVNPVASFTVEPAVPMEGSPAWFNDTSTNYESITWQWDFGDGTVWSTAQNTTHVFAQDGTYTVTLRITDAEMQSSEKSIVITVADGVPTAELRASTTSIDEGEMVRFYDQSSSSPDVITEYAWDFGDGETAVTRDADHRYTVNGTFEVTLTVTDADGDVSTAAMTMEVRDAVPVASFTASKLNPLKGETVLLADTSFSHDGIVVWAWDLGDGRTAVDQDVNVSYALPGQYVVALTITESDGTVATTNRTITVLQATPAVDGIIANGGEYSFLMDQEINLEVVASEVYVPIVRYAWDFDYDPTAGFTEMTNHTLNRTTWSYHFPGEHTICVRVYDADNYTEELLTVAVMNSRPVADISASLVKPGYYTFDAGKSTDTPTDAKTLQYRWNFGDGKGWTAWRAEQNAQKNYTEDGRYAVFLEVRDQWGYVGSATYNAVVDNQPPIIIMDTAVLSPTAYQGEDLVVKANVTDVSAIREVLLVYTTGNETKTLLMSRVSGTDTYVATVPAADIDGPLVFHVVATDADGYTSESGAISVSVLVRPDNTWIFIVAAALATIIGLFLLYYRAAAMVVDEVFIIYQDGNLMAHQTRRLKPGMDDQILGSMLVAIQEFVRDSFKDEASTGLSRMDFGDKKVLVEKGAYIYLAVVLHGKREGNVAQRMKDTISRTESDYYQALEGWDGDLDKVRGIKEETDSLLKSGVIEMMSAPFKKDTVREPVDMVVCSYCEAEVPADSPKCPRCGTVLSGAGKGRPADKVDGRKDSARPL